MKAEQERRAAIEGEIESAKLISDATAATGMGLNRGVKGVYSTGQPHPFPDRKTSYRVPLGAPEGVACGQ
ncbi:hypothetical protein RND71_014866 [Anisodus tanguticus]|uniref:Uncharacterized protein n=1 Tax=Anisodus tanguticus TaxID=243964 RepID=A0AAE1VK93_9SOLA|nr:hypothetical protein RND71_014866 [Anisodus tanguticus]